MIVAVSIPVCASPACFTATYEGWRGRAEDVSSTGARLITIDPIQGTRVWLKFLAQGQDHCFIEAEIVRAQQVPRSQFRSNDMMNSYGVRFSRLLSEPEFLELSLDQVERVTAGMPSSATPASKALAYR